MSSILFFKGPIEEPSTEMTAKEVEEAAAVVAVAAAEAEGKTFFYLLKRKNRQLFKM